MTRRFLAIDQGTTSTRATVFESGAPARSVAALRHRQIYPHPGWVEHDPRELLANVLSCIAAAGPIEAIGLANQGESCLAWDARTLAPLSPVIVWQDRRTSNVVDRLIATGIAPAVAACAGVPMDCYFSASKLSWIIGNYPEAAQALRNGRLRLGTTDSFLLENLTGTYATDATTASRTSLMSLSSLTWDPALCEVFSVPIEVLAPIRPSVGAFGENSRVPVRVSIVDQQAALFGHGCRRPGDAKITFGTGAFALALAGPTPPPAQADGLSVTIAWQTETDIQYALEGGVYDAGAALEWATRIGVMDHPQQFDRIDELPAISRGLLFLPALSGLACPRWNRRATGLWTGMTTATSRSDLQQSVFEGIALQTREVIQTLGRRAESGRILSVDGGLCGNDYFMQFLANVTGLTVVKRENTELTSLGCALLDGHDEPVASPETRGVYYHSELSSAVRDAMILRYKAVLAAGEALSDQVIVRPANA